MKIDCPHCGVSGSVDDALAGKKLRCPKCTKVFLVADEFLTAPVDSGMMRQEILYSDESDSQVGEEQPVEQKDIADEQESEELEGFVGLQDRVDETVSEEEPVEEEEETIEEEPAPAEDSGLLPCSACGQSFIPEVLVEVDSRLYCALCRPEAEEEDVSEEEESLEYSGESSLEEDEELEGFEFKDEDFGGAEDEDEEEPEFETCSQCGESLHPEFLETIGSKRYCAFCAPEDENGDQPLESAEYVEDIDTVDAVDLIQEDDNETEDDLDSIDSIGVEGVEEDDDSADEGYLTDACSVCGESFHPDFLQEVDSKLYCGLCQPEVIEVPSEESDDEALSTGSEFMEPVDTDEESDEYEGKDEEMAEDEVDAGQSDIADFTVGEVLKEAWQKTKGVKGAIWGGLFFMYLIIFGIGFGAAFALQQGTLITDPNTAMGAHAGVQLLTTWLSAVFSAGIMLIGVRRALEQRVSWKMVFSGFSKLFSITVALVLQIILVLIGFLLLIIPGIYLSVGYALTLPLILEKGLGPWQALEASRKAIHKKWWSVLGLYLIMGLIYIVSAIPLGIGLIWTVPMFFMVVGVLYKFLFASSPEGEDEIVEEDEESWLESETVENE